MSTKHELELIFSYMRNNNIELTIDNNPTQEKVNRILHSIQRKPQFVQKAIGNYMIKNVDYNAN